MSAGIIVQDTLRKLVLNIRAAGSGPAHNDEEAYMIAFLGFCVALDILAQDFYFNKEFKLSKNGVSEEEIKKDYEYFLKKRNHYKKDPLAGVGTVFKCFLKHRGLSDELSEKLYSFRCGMVHRFTPERFAMTHKSSEQKEFVVNDMLYLPECVIFLEQCVEDIKQEENWVSLLNGVTMTY